MVVPNQSRLQQESVDVSIALTAWESQPFSEIESYFVYNLLYIGRRADETEMRTSVQFVFTKSWLTVTI